MNGFDKNLQFIADLFESKVLHSLVLEMLPSRISIDLKGNNTGVSFLL